MILSKTKKIIIVLSIVSLSAFTFQPKPADAFFADWLNASIQVIGHAIQGTLLGIDSAANTIQTALQSVREVLNGLPIEYGPARKALSAATASCEVLGGNIFAIQTLTDLSGGGSGGGDALDTGFTTHDTNSKTTTHEALHPKGLNTGGTPIYHEEESHASVGALRADNGGLSAAQVLQSKIDSTNKTGVQSALTGLTGSLGEIGDQTKANLTLVLGQKLGLLKHRQTCYKILTQSIQSAMLVGGWNEQLKLAFQDSLAELSVKSSPVNSQINDLTKQQIAAKQDIFKAIATSVAQQTNEANTKATVDELKPKLTVSSYPKVADAIAKQVYAVEAIKKNYSDDPTGQLIMTSLLDAEIATDKTGKDQAIRTAQALVEGKVRSMCKQSYELSDYSNETTSSLDQLVSPECNVTVTFDNYKAKFGQIMAESKAGADNEVKSGNGFLSTRTCTDVSSQQKQVATTSATAAKKLEEAILKRSQTEKSSTATTEQLIAAINEERVAIAGMNSVPSAVKGGIVQSCGPIKDAGASTKAAFDNYINAWLTQGLQGTNNTNLPLATEFAKTLPGKLFGSFLLKAGVKNNVFTEVGMSFLNAVLTGAFNSNSTKGATAGQIPISSDQVSTIAHEAGHVVSSSTSSAGSNIAGSSSNNGSNSTPLRTTPTVNGAETSIPLSPYFSPRS